MWIAALAVIAFFMPNVRQLVRYLPPGAEASIDPVQRRSWHWVPNFRWALAVSVLSLAAVFGMNRISEFLYFQF